MTTKLNKALRAAIVDKALVAGRLLREAALKRQEQSLALRATKWRFGSEVFETCRALPEGWVGLHKNIMLKHNVEVPQWRLTVREGRHAWEKTGPSKCLSLSDLAPLPNSFAEPWTKEHFSASLFAEVVDFFTAHVALFNEMENLKVQLRAATAAFNTVERMAVDWPEGYAFLPAEMLLPTTANLPAPVLDDLNKRLAAFRQAEAA